MATRYTDLTEQSFDPSRRYMVRKPFVMSGKRFSFGDVFDSTLTSTRRHRQLYEQRWITIDERPVAQAVGNSDNFINIPAVKAAAPRQHASPKRGRRNRAA